MKKIVLVLALAVFLPAAAGAGEIANIMGVDMMIGTFAGAAMGTALATPSYMSGGKNASPATFYAGAGWGALIGSILGIGYGVYDLTTFFQTKQSLKKQAGFFNEDERVYLKIGYSNLTLMKKF